MSAPARHARLVALAAMKRDADLARLGKAAAECAELRARLDTLAALARGPVPVDPALFAVRQRHLSWAEAQRRALNQKLAAATADWMALRARATRSFGRAAALQALQRKRTLK